MTDNAIELSDLNSIVDVEVVDDPNPPVPADPVLDKLLGRIAPVDKVSDYMKLMLFGPPGCGKTFLAGGAPKPLIIDVDRGSVTIAGKDFAKDAKVMKFVSIKQLELLIDYLKRGEPAFDPYETIVIDTLSEVHKRGLTEIANREANIRTNTFVNETPDHMENNERIRRIVSDLRDLDRHIVVNCHTKNFENKKTGISTKMPDFSEKLTNTVNAVFDIIGYLFRETDMEGNTIRQLRVGATGGFEVKTRIDTMPEVVMSPSWSKLYAYYTQFAQKAQQTS